MVEKRTLVFVSLAIIVWAATATTIAGYYYLQNSINNDQLGDSRKSLNKIAANYSIVTEKYDSLLGDCALIRSSYLNHSYYSTSDYVMLMPALRIFIINLGRNYSDLLMQADLNKSYAQLLTDFDVMAEKNNVTEADFGHMLNKCDDLLSQLAFRELSWTLNEATTLSVNVEIDYGNGTTDWLNVTQSSAGQTLFGIMQKIAIINYSYYAFTEPGHVLVESINNVSTYTDPSYAWGYSWIWCYYDDTTGKWANGPVGCDAWLLKNDGTYKWSYERWQYS